MVYFTIEITIFNALVTSLLVALLSNCIVFTLRWILIRSFVF
jgi:hypothetical protein